MSKVEVTEINLGESVEKRPLSLKKVSLQPNQKKQLLILGGVHGDELEGVWLVSEFLKECMGSFEYQKFSVLIWPEVNPDGVSVPKRWNANNVDLNRNLPTKDWNPNTLDPRYPPGPNPNSEPESQALVKLIEHQKPFAILSAHSFSQFQVNYNGPSQEWAQELAKVCGYPVTSDIGYPTPGSLGTFAGKERSIPTITLEIERGMKKEDVLKLHLPVLYQTLKFWEARL
ncbi:MAG: DUF2817 domain-containing protein [Bacteriovoracia bacterium]